MDASSSPHCIVYVTASVSFNASPTSLMQLVVGQSKASAINMAKGIALPLCMGGWESCLLLDLYRQKLIKITDRQDWKASETKSPLLLGCFQLRLPI